MLQKEEKNKRLDVNVLKGSGGEILDSNLLIAKMRSLKRWIRRVVNIDESYEIKVSELRQVVCKTDMLNGEKSM